MPNSRNADPAKKWGAKTVYAVWYRAAEARGGAWLGHTIGRSQVQCRGIARALRTLDPGCYVATHDYGEAMRYALSSAGPLDYPCTLRR